MEVKLDEKWGSPFSRRVELALKFKGIQYEYVEEDLSNKNLLIMCNPVQKKVPLLVHNGKPIAESLVILEYIDEIYPDNPIMPQDPYERAKARFWAKFVDETILQTARKCCRGKDEEEQNQAVEELRHHLKLLDIELKQKDYFGGDTIGYLDISLFFIIIWLVDALSEDKFPALYKWIGKLLDMGVVMECLPSEDIHLAYFRAKFGAGKYTSN